VHPVEMQDRLQQFQSLCRQRGLSLTVQRQRIFELILERRDHPTADQVYEDVKVHVPGVSRTTVYRVLDMLVDLGVILKAPSPGSSTRYDPMTRHHHHLVCRRCETLIDLEDAALDSSIQLPGAEQTQAFQIESYSIHFYGICESCRSGV
jgi:Fur family peroxide stress response transcriptional regulator